MTARLVVAAAVLALAAFAFAFKASSKMPDFEVYWRAGERAASAEPLYRAEDEHYQFKYLPAFALLAIPLSLVPLAAAKAFWFAASVALIPLVLLLSLRLLPERRRPRWLLVAFTAVVMAKFYAHELVLGQVNLLLAAVLLAAAHMILAGRKALAGLLVALAVIVKPYALIFVGWFAGTRELRALAASVAGLASAALLTVPVYGAAGTLALHQDWWRTVTGSTPPNLLNADNVSVAAMYAKWIGPGGHAASLSAATAAVLLGGAAYVIAARRRVRTPAGLEAASLMTLMPLLSPQGWDYVFLVSTPAVMYALNYEGTLRRGERMLLVAALATIGFSVYDVLGRRLYGTFMMLSIITLCFLVLIAVLVALRARRVA